MRSNFLEEVSRFSPIRKVASRLNWGLWLYLKGVNIFWHSRLFWAQVKRVNTHFSNGKPAWAEVFFSCLGYTSSTLSCHILKDVSRLPFSSAWHHTFNTYLLLSLRGLRRLFCQSKHMLQMSSTLLLNKCVWKCKMPNSSTTSKLFY